MMTGDAPATAFKALAVGNAAFPADPHRLSALNGPLNDVEAVCAALSDPDTGLFRCQRPLKDATGQVLLDTVEEFFTAAEANDCLLFYYSGHGRIDLEGDFYLCARDTDTATLGSPRLTGSHLGKVVARSPALLKIIVLDCCYASEFKGEVWTPGYFRGRGRFVLAATRGPGSPLVPDAPTPHDLSPFTALLVEALRRGDLDTDHDGYVTARDVGAYISDRARRAGGAPFALEQWAGTGVVPLARSPRAHGSAVVLPPRPSATAAPITAAPITAAPITTAPITTAPITAAPVPPPAAPDVVGFPIAVRPGPLPDLLPTPDGFRLGRHLVTNGQFRVFLLDPANDRWRPRAARREGRHVDGNYLRHWDDLDFPPEREHEPVVAVGARAAGAYAEWAGGRLGLPLRLPRADEWERAARAGRRGDWVAADVAEGRVNFRRTLGALSEVGEFQAGPHGLADLLGNAWETCVDAAGRPVLRGGAFDTPEHRLLEELVPSSAAECRADTGFRCACSRM
ncbi:SUMF1/EgtB/PvdO family nonheme iron enzyme [Saccharothrix algeriensis]|uniref:Caspase family p20 domain-containing protein n=1 Tax=Saccharothrix algeriensis TaxID=173560 RepID=A0ABS2SGT6_9PSEU|nr:SUMF1/EgtB/PvdO family nonheme iron enzyme [Saccharothrix algeriensis]MBM7815005.1 hypothetical protein [Saccharothrix algeriensis]